MAITGVVFALLLSGLQEELQTTIPWVDFVVHKLMPVVLVADWLVDPPRHRLPRWTVLAWLSYPLAWVTYTLVRGEAVDWYPYPFVDVSRLGYDGVLGAFGRAGDRICRRGRSSALAREPASEVAHPTVRISTAVAARDHDVGDELGREDPVVDHARPLRRADRRAPADRRTSPCSRR